MIRPFIRAAAWALLCLLAFFTLCPIDYRPHLTADPQVERALAYFLTGSAFGCAYPRRRRVAAGGLVFAVAALEAAQLLVPGRDGHVRDAAAKALGALGGLAFTAAAAWLVQAISGRQGSSPDVIPHAAVSGRPASRQAASPPSRAVARR